MLVLQVVVQAEALAGEVLADDGHAEVACRPCRRTPSGTGSGSGRRRRRGARASREQRLPLLVRQAAALPVGAGVLAPVVEEPDVVVLLLERLDLALDEVVELVEVVGEVRGELEVH